MESNWIKWVNTQLGASFDMLKIAIDTATYGMWDHNDDDPPFWKIAAHVIFYIDFYFTTFNPNAKNINETYQLPEFLSHYDDPWIHNLKNDVVPKNEIMSFLESTRKNLRVYFEGEIENQLSDPSGFEWLPITKGELLLYNMRHIMEHTAILNQILKKHQLPASKWKGMAVL